MTSHQWATNIFIVFLFTDSEVVLHIASQFKTVFAVFPVGPALPPQSEDVSQHAS